MDVTVITPYRDGPLVVRGRFRLVDQDGADIEIDRETVTLCRCGRSRLRPFCDGSHKLTRFSAPSGAEDLGRLLLREAAGEVDRGDVLVHGVGHDVLVEEPRRGRLTAPQPAHPARIAAVGDRRRHLEQREVPDDRAPEPAVQAAAPDDVTDARAR